MRRSSLGGIMAVDKGYPPLLLLFTKSVFQNFSAVPRVAGAERAISHPDGPKVKRRCHASTQPSGFETCSKRARPVPRADAPGDAVRACPVRGQARGRRVRPGACPVGTQTGTKLVAVHEVKAVKDLREPREEAYSPNVLEARFWETGLPALGILRRSSHRASVNGIMLAVGRLGARPDLGAGGRSDGACTHE